jgi:hypothetical protein
MLILTSGKKNISINIKNQMGKKEHKKELNLGQERDLPANPIRILDICKIQESLLDVQKNFSTINTQLTMHREPLKDKIIERMVLGYSYLNELTRRDVDIFSKEGLSELTELNYIVHYGHDAELRFEGHKNIIATRDRFYKHIKNISKWYDSNIDESGWKRASGVYVRILSGPQLFIEGNHRTGNLIMDYILLRDGLPPFVLNTYNAVKYFEPSTKIKMDLNKENPADMWLKLPKYKKKFREFLKEYTSEEYVIKSKD